MKTKVCQTSEIPANQMKAFDVDGVPVLVANVGGTFYAIADTCSHAEGSLCEGTLDAEELTVECPLHGAVFKLNSGEAIEFPAEDPVACYTAMVEGDDVFVEPRS